VPVARVVARRKAPDPALFVGSGKADEIKALVAGHQAEAVLFDQACRRRSSATSSATSACRWPTARC
jgi:50S ribosomal subunit-associated GTPase HflX